MKKITIPMHVYEPGEHAPLDFMYEGATVSRDKNVILQVSPTISGCLYIKVPGKGEAFIDVRDVIQHVAAYYGLPDIADQFRPEARENQKQPKKTR